METMGCVQEIDPLRDSRWLRLLERHPQASVFHSPGWLEALRRTYGYSPAVLTTTSSSQDLMNGIVFCRVSSWLTGRRVVSLPFSDHCEPLVDRSEELGSILEAFRNKQSDNGWRYAEIRPAQRNLGEFSGFAESRTCCLHRLDLRPGLPEIFGGFHKDCVQRKIWRAEREGLTCEEGTSERLLRQFYRLLVGTRRRQMLLPQPRAWFRNLIACMREGINIHVVSKDGQPVASILTLSYKTTLVYKYGCSDKRRSNLGGVHLLFWKAIQSAKEKGFREFDLGRSDWTTPGLVEFKDRWGAARSTLTYWRRGAIPAIYRSAGWKNRTVRRIFEHAPRGFLATTGSLLYRHAG